METKYLITFIENNHYNTQWVDEHYWAEKLYNEYLLDENKSEVTIEERNDYPPTIPND